MTESEIKRVFSIYVPEDLYDKLTEAMKKEHRSRNQQVIHWIRLGKLLDANPDMKMALQLKEQLQ